MTDPALNDFKELFSHFEAAVKKGDSAAFEALCAEDVPPQTALFEKNAARVREAKWDLRLKSVTHTGDAAELTFSVLDEDGAEVDEGAVTVTLEGSGWKIREL
jgi:hypothetical protein